MKEFKYPFLVLEFTLADVLRFPQVSRIPKIKRKGVPSSRVMLKRILEIQIHYGIHVALVGNKGQDYARSLFKRIQEAERG